jgi:ethanolamine utilization protein EutM
MSQESLGLIETVGLAAAIAAADAAVKSANVTLVGYELTKGDGMAVVKLRGDVGAVKAAVAAAEVAAARIGKVVASRVIARPAVDLTKVVDSRETVGAERPEQTVTEPVAQPRDEAPVAEPVTLPEAAAATASGNAGDTEADAAAVDTAGAEPAAEEPATPAASSRPSRPYGGGHKRR